MGHLVNPIAIRLSINMTWNSNWSLVNNNNYIDIFKKDYLLYQFLNLYTKRKQFMFKDINVSHYKLYRVNNKVFINLYYYFPLLDIRIGTKILFNSLKVLLQRKWRRYNKLFREKYYFHEKFEFRVKKLKKNISRLYRYIIKFLISNLFFLFLTKSIINTYINKLEPNSQFYFNIYNYDVNDVNPDFITLYIAARLQQKYTLNFILKPVLRDLKHKLKKGFIYGYKLLCAGRFTRKQVATFSWSKDGKTKLNKFSSLVRYSQARVRLKFGVGGIKLWIDYGHYIIKNSKIVRKGRLIHLIYPKYCPLKFYFNKVTKKIILFLNYWSFMYLKIRELRPREKKKKKGVWDIWRIIKKKRVKKYLPKYKRYIMWKIGFYLFYIFLKKKPKNSWILNLKFYNKNKFIIFIKDLCITNTKLIFLNKQVKILKKNIISKKLFKYFYE